MTLAATLVVGVVLVVSALALVMIQRRQLLDNLDSSLRLRADEVSAGIVASDADPDAFAAVSDREQVAQLVTPDGRVVAASTGLGAAAISEPPAGAQGARTIRGLPVEDDAFRVLSRRIDTPSGTVVLHLGENIDDLNDSIRVLTASLAVTVPLVIAAVALIVWWMVGRTLRPVETIRREVADIGAADLHRRVPAVPGDDEVARLAQTMNAMLDRLEDAARRQRTFVADASHELRSPLTRMRTELEVALAHLGDTDPEATLSSALEEVTGLQRLVSDLLHLARSDAGMASGRRVPVDLDDIVLRETRRLRSDGHTVDLGGVSAARVDADADQLTRAVRNLLDNAARHADGRVVVTLGEVRGEARLTVADDGPGIAVADRERIFERFTRLDDARTRDAGGSGLGLAIARDVVEAHGGTVVLDDGDGVASGARFVVTLPTTA